MAKIVVFGAQKICVDIIKNLVGSGVDIPLVIESEQPRDAMFLDKFVENTCADLNIPCQCAVVPEELNKIAPDLIISAYYRKILPESILKTPKFGSVNLHPGLLPKYRGCVPTYWAMLNGEREAGITLHYMTAGIDDGNIIAQKKTQILGKTGAQLHVELMNAGVELIKENLNSMLSCNSPSFAQDHAQATYFGPYRDVYRYINWNNTAELVLRHIMAHSFPFEGSVTWNKYCEIRINGAKIINDNGWACGKYKLCDQGLIVQAQDKKLLLNYTILSGDLNQAGLFISGPK